jgi:DNA repair photolyase
MKILSRPKKNAEEYGKWAVNAYLGCQNRCKYCFLQTGPGAKNLGGSVAKLKAHVINEEHAYHLAMAEIIEHKDEIIRDGGLFMTFTSDPCLPNTRNLSLTIAHDAAYQMHIPVMLLTKDATFLNLDSFTEQILGFDKTEQWSRSIPFYHTGHGRLDFIDNPHFTSDPDPIAFGFSLTGHDELEPCASPNAERIKAMVRLAAAGFKTWASIEPVIDFDSSLRMIQQALDAGCQHFKIGLMTERTKVCRRGFTLGGQTFEPYDPARCLAFVQDVMQQTRDRATVYWKQSFRDFIGGTGKHRLFTDDELHKIFDDYPNAVGKDWSFFKVKSE